MSTEALVTKPASGHWTDAYPGIRPRPRLARGLRFGGVLRQGTRARLQEDLALHGARRAGAAVRQLFHPRDEIPEHLDHHRARQGRRDPRLPQHLPAPREQDAVERRPVRGSAGPRTVAVLPLPRLALQPGRLAALSHPQGSAARLRCRQLPGAGDSVRSVGRLHLHQPQPAQHRVGSRLSSASWRTASRAIRSKDRTRCTDSRPSCSATGRSSSTASRRVTTARICTRRRSAPSPRRPRRRSTSPIRSPTRCAYQLKGPHRMFSFAGEPSQKTPYSKPIECVMEASAAGPWTKRTDRGPMPAGLNPTRSEKYGFDSYQFFPNFVLIFGASGFTVHTHWPTGPHSHIFEDGDVLPAARRPTRNGWDRS